MASPTLAPPDRLPLRRPEGARWVGGVGAGLAVHLDVPVAAVRAVLALLAASGPVGLALYVFWWVSIPSGDAADVARDTAPAARKKLSRGLVFERARALPLTDVAVAVLLLAAAVLLVASRHGMRVDVRWVLPVLVVLAGVGLAWSQLDKVERGRLLSGGRTPGGLVRLVAGVVLVLVGVLLLVGRGEPVGALVTSGAAAVAVLGGVAIVLAPWWLRLGAQLRFEREARARESERADIAAHLHDSVLQTLALIRRGSGDADQVARLARAQERELREWLYSDRPVAGTSVAADLRAVVAEVEDGRAGRGGPAVAVDTVVVGDCAPSATTTALLQATREALVNAVAHGAPPVSLYLEVGQDSIDVFVRDRGEGFDVDAIPTDRFGVRESVLGRVRRRGGQATITSSKDRGTEVHLRVPHEPSTENGRGA